MSDNAAGVLTVALLVLLLLGIAASAVLASWVNAKRDPHPSPRLFHAPEWRVSGPTEPGWIDERPEVKP